jgi:hypothetical protein
MKMKISRSRVVTAFSLLLVLASAPARALDILTFDFSSPDRNEVVGSLGFSITHAGSNALSGLDFSLFDVIYVSPSLDEAGLQSFLGSRAGDVTDFLGSGGSLVYGSYYDGNENESGSDELNRDFSGLLSDGPVDPILEPAAPQQPAVVTAVPEPGTLALFGLGAACFLLFFRRRFKF